MDFSFITEALKNIPRGMVTGAITGGAVLNKILSSLSPNQGMLQTPYGEMPRGFSPETSSQLVENMRKNLQMKTSGKSKEGGSSASGGESGGTTKPQGSNMVITTPTPAGGKMTIKIDKPQWSDKPEMPNELWEFTQNAANQFGINPDILASLTAQETGGYNYEPRRGASGERGNTQIIPEYFYKNAGFPSAESYGNRLEQNPQFSLEQAAMILASLLKMYGGDYQQALGGYNAGPQRPQMGAGYANEVLGRIGR